MASPTHSVLHSSSPPVRPGPPELAGHRDAAGDTVETNDDVRAAPRWGAVRVAQALSLDVVAGVLGAAAFAAVVSGARPPAVWWWLVPACTWTVYSVDHLLDARRIRRRACSFRHRLYQRHSTVLAVHTLLVALAATAAAFSVLPPRLLFPGLAVALAALAHLGLAQAAGRRLLPKELSAAGVYTLGIWFAPLMLAPAVDLYVLLLAGSHFLAALLNLTVFSLFEHAQDVMDGQVSLVRSWGVRHSRRMVSWLTATGVAAVGAVLVLGPGSLALPGVVLLVLLLAPTTMLMHAGYCRANARYRLYGDLSFVLLALPYVVSRLFHGP